MKFSKTLLTLAAVAGLCSGARAQISVGLGGSTTYNFSATPPPSEWATTNGFNTAGGAGAYTTVAQLVAGIQTLAHTAIGTNLPATAANATSAYARHNTTGGYLVTQPTGVGAGLIKATLRNTSGGQIHSIAVTYDFGVQNTPANESPGLTGHQVFFSTNGAAGSWNLIPALSGLSATTAGVTATLFLDVWEPDTDIHLLWADDNASVANSTDGAYSIDNFVASSVVTTNATVPLSVILSSPVDGQWVLAPANVTVSAAPAGTVPATSVSFYTNGVFFTTVAGPGPFSAPLNGLPAGTYAVYVTAENGVDPVATSGTSTIFVRPDVEFAEYTGGTYSQDFAYMTTAGTLTPFGWYVGQAATGTTVSVTVDNGSLAPSGILGYNYGSVGSADRSLGTAATGGDRNTVLRLRNSTGSNLVSFVIKYDAETWRTHASATTNENLTNYVSFDRGATWITTGANYLSPNPGQAPAAVLDGNNPANRVADITSPTISPPSPVPPDGIIYVRWQNFNEGGTDGGMAIDNVTFTGTAFTEAVLSVTITSPTNEQSFAGGCPNASDITVNASASTIAGHTVTNIAFQLDGGAAVDDDTVPFSAVLAGVPVGPHTITATATDTTGNTASTMVTVMVLLTPNQPPQAAITNTYCFTTNSPQYLVGSSITNDIAMSDDSGITNVAFLVNGALHLNRSATVGRVVVNNVLAGVNTYQVVATDTCGLSVTSAPVVITITNPPVLSILVSNGSIWQYDNSNTDLGTAWINVFFDDSAWPVGAGDLGDNGVAENTPARTIIGIGAATRIPTIYFRHYFNVPSTVGITNLVLNVLRDDGVAVYLNGDTTAAYRNNLAAGAAFATFASVNSTDDGRTYQRVNISPLNIVDGFNVIAVEVHNQSGTSSDLTFDLMLWAEAEIIPSLTIAFDPMNPGNVLITPAIDGNLRASTDVAASVNTWPILQAVTAGTPVSIPYVSPPNAPHRFFQITNP